MPEPIRKGVVDLRNRSSVRLGGVKPAAHKTEAYQSFLKDDVGHDYSKIERYRRKRGGSKLLTLLIILLVLLVGAAAASFYFFGPGSGGSSIKLSLATPTEAAAGDNVTITVTYQNLDKIKLTNLELVMQYPDGFYYNSSNLAPFNAEQNIWKLPDLEVNGSGSVEIIGQLMGEQDQSKEFKAIFNYQPTNIHSNFSENLTKAINLTKANLQVSFLAPEKISPNDPIEFKADILNNLPDTFKNLQAALQFPKEGFKQTSATPTPAKVNYTWNFSELESNKTQTIDVKGSLASSSLSSFPYYFKVFTKDASSTAERVWFSRTGQIQISVPSAQLNLEKVSPAKVNWGDKIQYKISVLNNGQFDINDGILKLNLAGPVDWQNFKDTNGGTIQANNIVWDKSALTQLAGLSPSSTAEITVLVPTQAAPVDIFSVAPEDLSITATADLNYNYKNRPITFSSQPMRSGLTNQTAFAAEARYYVDASSKVGSGPVPPVIGKTTSYRIYWKIISGSDGLKNVVIKTVLPKNVKFEKVADEASLGNHLAYDENSRQMSWTIDEMGASSQGIASFQVSITPIDSQVNQLVILSNATTLTASNKLTNALVSKTADLLTSDLAGDPKASGQGRVRVK